MINRINNSIQKDINPSLELHKGSCKAVEFKDGVLTLQMFGGCSGCPSARLTLFNGIVPILQEKFPEIKDFELV